MQEGHSSPPDRQTAATPLHLSPERENLARPSRVGLDPRAEEEDTRGEDAGETSETPQVQSRDCGSTRHPPLPKDLSTAHPETALPEVGEGDCPGLQDRPAIPVCGDTVSPRSGGGIPCQSV